MAEETKQAVRETLRAHIEKAPLSEEEKSNSLRHIEEWYAEDQAFGLLYEKLAAISPALESLLGELGLL
jgi:uncharacterized protein (UPF0335 family)